MRANKEARKKEMEEMERMKAQLLEEEVRGQSKSNHDEGLCAMQKLKTNLFRSLLDMST